MKIRLIPAFTLILLAASCTAPKNVVYFQQIDSMTEEQISKMYQNYTSRICPDDLLSITVTSKLPDVVTPFNPPLYSYAIPASRAAAFADNAAAQPNVTNINNSVQLTTYPVNSEGDITFPVIGRFHAAGMSRQELENRLQEEVRAYVKDAIVHVRVENYKVTVLGEVARPGVLTVQNERITVLEAIGNVGDLSINGNRNNILIIRENDGQKEYGRIDITDPAVFVSPYYYLRQNDVVYVEPNKAKQKSARVSTGETYTISVFSAVISCLSTLTAITIAISNSLK